MKSAKLSVQVEREDDGRWIAGVPEIPGALVYGSTREEALTRVEALVLQVLADRLEHGEAAPQGRPTPAPRAVKPLQPGK
jgi:predicted RNase H-like HicB family nuclease